MCTPRVAITAVPPSLAPCPGGGHAGAWPLPASFRRRLVLAGLLGLVGLLPGLVHRAVGVLRRAVNGVEDQRVLAGVDEVVLPAGGGYSMAISGRTPRSRGPPPWSCAPRRRRAPAGRRRCRGSAGSRRC